ncbi:Ig-like domain-containing protein [Chryseobacterium sp.]|uniref:Ig-like domain-containing protein n=1 Tax=Chryseobacterium sp. TaxID=1871047 RepID=UPI00389087FB
MKTFCTFIFTFLITSVYSQNSNKIYTSDIDNFWTAYDSIQKSKDFHKNIQFINTLYIEPGTKGLHAFMKARNYNDSLYVQLIKDYPKFWNSVRPHTLEIKNKTTELNLAVEKLKKLYPNLKDAEMYFTIGGLRSGGTVDGNKVLVGAEIATGNSTVDVSEFENSWLKNTFEKQSLDNIVYLNIHEYIHTQQNGGNNRVLNQSIKEGSCDFIAQLALDKPIQTQYLNYGRRRLAEIKDSFRKEMFSANLNNWLYNGSKKTENPDLGYFVGYEICKSYYQNSENKSEAIKDIIELNYNDDQDVEHFLIKSKFFSEKIDKNKIIKEYNKNLPMITKIDPFKNNAQAVDPSIKELRITFSKQMDTKNFSISLSEKGKEYFPITKIKGYENNDTTLVLLIDLKPNKNYEFIINNKGFKSKDGYPLKDDKYSIQFKTK